MQRSYKTQPQAAAVPNHSRPHFFCSLPQKEGCRTTKAFSCSPCTGRNVSHLGKPFLLHLSHHCWRCAWSKRSKPGAHAVGTGSVTCSTASGEGAKSRKRQRTQPSVLRVPTGCPGQSPPVGMMGNFELKEMALIHLLLLGY